MIQYLPLFGLAVAICLSYIVLRLVTRGHQKGTPSIGELLFPVNHKLTIADKKKAGRGPPKKPE
ncbi:MAG: hypothetical protein BEU04_02035 [Marine Group III euryarchaeote CG-Bathy1]|uniref:Uncharacterized protein n=1 Tax=Marine Group III euryarchaeote CG-Bathy1 TaxID=1889001 RepID=A0A1J5TPT3_9ARCH|nr:MAG: hypothetical protein BEU04_02035 [Marine Group III euryarchaeote CG-Bathy1]